MRVFPVYIAILLVPAFVGLALSLTFVKVNGKPFSHALESFVRYHSKSRLYLWKKQLVKVKKEAEQSSPKTIRDTLSESKLKTLSWSLDVIDSKKEKQ